MNCPDPQKCVMPGCYKEWRKQQFPVKEDRPLPCKLGIHDHRERITTVEGKYDGWRCLICGYWWK